MLRLQREAERWVTRSFRESYLGFVSWREFPSVEIGVYRRQLRRLRSTAMDSLAEKLNQVLARPEFAEVAKRYSYEAWIRDDLSRIEASRQATLRYVWWRALDRTLVRDPSLDHCVASLVRAR